jgi:hypothetical protein
MKKQLKGSNSETNLQRTTNIAFMKTIITQLSISILAAFALVGCGQKTSSDSTSGPGTNSTMNGGAVNMPSTNSLSQMNTNMPASTNQ